MSTLTDKIPTPPPLPPNDNFFLDREETLLRGYIPIDEKAFQKVQSSTPFVTIDFEGNGYVTDALLQFIQKQDVFSGLKSVSMVGCNFITDYGISCLVHALRDATGLKEIILDGCTQLTDNSVAMLLGLAKNNPQLKCSLMGTSLAFLTNCNINMKTTGCASLAGASQKGEMLESHILVYPHPDVKKSFAQYMCSGSVQDKAVGFHANLKTEDWTLSLTELPHSSVLKDSMMASSPSQVVIPFDASSDPQSIRHHVMTTISQVVAKEPQWCEFPQTVGPAKHVSTMSKRPWVNTHLQTYMKLYEGPSGESLLTNVFCDPEKFGVWISAERLTRSHPYFELVINSSDSSVKSAVLIGCLFDHLYNDRNPMDSSSQVGGFVDAMELEDGQEVTVGFGVEGEWISEYVPNDDAQFYFVEKGVKRKGKMEDTVDLTPCCSMYPLVSLLVEKEDSTGCVATLPLMVKPPEDLAKRWKAENRWIEKAWSTNVLIDNYGHINYCSNYTTTSLDGIFYGRDGFSSENTEFSITITNKVNTGDFLKDAAFSFGVARELVKGNTSYLLEVTWDSGGKFCNLKPVKNGHESLSFDVKTIDPRPVKVGDVFTVRCSDLNNKKVTLKFYHNDDMILEEIVTFKVTGTKTFGKLVPKIQLLSGSGSATKYVLKLMNYRPTYKGEAPYRDRITVGRAHFINVMDDGTVYFKENTVKDKEVAGSNKLYGQFIAKTPFNKDMLRFQVRIIEMEGSKLCGIGVTEPDVNTDKFFIGWKQGTLGYHADNGETYANSGSGVSKESKLKSGQSTKFEAGDMITVEIRPNSDNSPLIFDEFGNLDSQQTVIVAFLKNSELVYERSHLIQGASLYPALSLNGTKVQIENFYPETAEVWESLTIEKEKQEGDVVKKEPKPEVETVNFLGTEFLIVGLASGSSDPSGKLQIVRQQLDFSDWPEFNSLETVIGQMEKDLSLLDFEAQHSYGQLCGMRDNMRKFTKHCKQRVRYTSMNLTSDDSAVLKQERDGLLKDLIKLEKRRKAFQNPCYNIVSSMLPVVEALLKQLLTSKVILLSNLHNEVTEFEPLEGTTVVALLTFLQTKGKLLILDTGHDKLIVNIAYLMMLEQRIWTLEPTEMMKLETVVTGIGLSSHVWDVKSLDANILTDIESTDKRKLIKSILRSHLGLIRLPCLRTKPADEHHIYTLQSNITNPPVSMTSYWNASKDNTDFVVVGQTYEFPFNSLELVLPLLIANTVKYGSVVILTGEGVVYHNGAVQSVIVKHQEGSGNGKIIVESSCYMPDLEETKMSKETTAYVRDYTFNVFSILTDIIDDFLKRANIPTIVTRNYPSELMKTSVGCKHDWTQKPDVFTSQSICTMCDECVCSGDECKWNGIMEEQLRHSECDTHSVGCHGCGICVVCADELWSVRSRLRPHGTMLTKIHHTIHEKTRKITEAEEENRRKEVMRDPVIQPQIALDPHVYNEVEFENFCPESKYLCLKEESDGTITKMFPGVAAIVKDLSQISSAATGGATAGSKSTKYTMHVGDKLKIKLSDPFGCSMVEAQQDTGVVKLQIEPQYFTCIGREVKVIHESGIVLYETESNALPVSQLISCRPMTKQFNHFSIKVLSTGDKATIAMGLAPVIYAANRQPGWNAQSIGYHADDGGIYLESGNPTRKTKTCAVGDIMALYIDFDKNKGWFRKNGEKMIELNLNPNKLAYYPMIGLHSNGEAVQIIEKNLWQPKNESDKAQSPPSFATYKYGNLWISPGDQVTLCCIPSAAGKADTYRGWLVLHNPIKDPVGFKVTFGETFFFGSIEHKLNWVQNLKFVGNKHELHSKVSAVIIEWTSLESGRTYSEADMKILFGETLEKSNQNSHEHRLPFTIKENKNTQVENLPIKNPDNQPKSEDIMCLQIYKNLRLIEEYWLKYGKYMVSVESASSKVKFLLKYPKCPTFTYPRSFQKGMKVVVCLEKGKVYAESVVVDVYSGGRSVALEYSPKDKNVNMTVCMMTSSSAFTFPAADFDENEATILSYEARTTPSNLVQTFIQAPSYLISEGSLKIQAFLQPEWKAHVIHSVARCSQQFTRITVQEKDITDAARKILQWINISDSKYHFTFLPQELTESTLTYPQPADMYRDIAVHRLCFSQAELLSIMNLLDTYSSEEVRVNCRLPLHFVDILGIIPSEKLGVDTLYADAYNVWNYVALIAYKMLIPSYKNLIGQDEGDSRFNREQIEHLMYVMCRKYASLCGIYSATCGGIQFTPANTEKTVKYSIQHNSKDILIPEMVVPIRDTHKLIKQDSHLMCKAHYINMNNDILVFEDKVEFDYEYFEPYADLLTTYQWCHAELEKLPSDFFERFRQLVHFKLGSAFKKMTMFTALPMGIGKTTKLRAIEIENTAMTELPEDFFMSNSVLWISCSKMPIKSLPKTWPTDSPLRVLVLAGLLLDEVPPEMSVLSELRELELCYNQLTNLPDSLADLKNLTMLKLVGAPWVRLEGLRSQITQDQYNQIWNQQFPSLKEYIGEQKIDDLFDEYDYNHNGLLDEEEIAALSLELFFKVPRIGIKDINDEVTGGIPPVIFKMKNLSILHLNNNAITMVPPSINNLQNLKELSLSHNPLLESLPGSLGHLPNIKTIQIQSCPMLRTPPNEIVSRGFDSVKAYLKRLAGGFTECRRTKLMVVGLGGAGKTSLLRALMSVEKKTSGTEKEIPTDGIDIVPWTVKSEDGREVTYSTWDFAGQAVYYNTHQFFLSKRAVYLLLWSMRQGYEHAGLDFWLSSICCHAPGTPIIVIGTQCDLIPKAEIPEKELIERYPQIASFHRVSSIEGIGIEELQRSLLDITLQQGYMGEKIPQVWLNFEKRILAERLTKKSYIKWEVARQYAMEQGIFDEKDVKMAVQLLHDLGTIQYFDNDFLRDYVVINPQWIVNVMACVVSAQDSPIGKQNGRFLHSDIPVIWKDYDESLHQWLLRLTEDFDLTFPLPREPVNIVPCLLPGEPPDDLEWPNIRDQKGVRETKMVYRFTYLPSGLFNRAQVRLFQFSDGSKVWKKGSLLSKNKHLALIKQSDNKELAVFVQGPRPENILFLIHEVFESIIEESFNGVSYELFLPCPDCVTKEGTTEPDLLRAKLIQRAKDMKAPFIQCYKYFHWISMAQLQEKMPSDSREVADFDFQLQQSIVALEELNNDLVHDTAILYSKADVPSSGDMESFPPAMLRDDIVSWGHTCWFAEDMDSVSNVDIATAIKNCKILIALVSDNFERDEKCCDILIHARDTLNKETIIAIIGTTMEWESKDLGMMIGKQERKLMVKTKERYLTEGGRRGELQEWLSEKLQAMKMQESSWPDVFISYNWSNSRIAAEKSLRINSHALGWGDPRDIKVKLQKEGLNCWIDTEYVGKEKKGIFADMAAGIRNSKVMLVFVSDEYTESDNCMMELRFGILNMELPVVAAIVGTGAQWKETEVAMLLRRSKAPEVHMQNENEAGVDVMVKFIRDALQKINLTGQGKKQPKEKKKKSGADEADGSKKEKGNSSVAYQEEFELIQRKFMRHILGSDSTPLPRLVVIDFVHSAKHAAGEDGRDSRDGSNKPQKRAPSKKILRPKTATKSRDRLQVAEGIDDDDDDVENWTKESFCIKVLCEHEEGWHICQEMYPLAFRTREHLENFVKKAAPYLFRIFTILKQSPLKLKCFDSSKGEAFLQWIRLESEDNLDFVGAMMHLRSELAKDEAANFASCLARCRLPSGKIVWLCQEHQNYPHVAKLSTGSSGMAYSTMKVLHTEDKLLMANMLESQDFKTLKGIKSDKVAPDMPAPIPIPKFVPNIPQVREVPVTEVKGLKDTKADDKDAPKTDQQKDTKPTITNVTKADSDGPSKTTTNVTGTNRKDDTKKVSQDDSKSDTKANEAAPKETIRPASGKKQVENTSQQESKPLPSEQEIIQHKKSKIIGQKVLQNSEAPIKELDEVIEKKNVNGLKNTDMGVAGGDSSAVSGNKDRSKNIANGKPPREMNQEQKEEKKDEIKRMLVHADSKALAKAMKVDNGKTGKGKGKVTGGVSSKNFAIQPSDMSKSRNGKQQRDAPKLIRGSNIKRGHSTNAFTSGDLSIVTRASSQSSTASLGGTLSIKTVNGPPSSIISSKTKESNTPSSGGSVRSNNSKGKQTEKHPLERVRPKRIVVRSNGATGGPADVDTDTTRRQSMKATGLGIGTTKASDMPSPERTSKACVIQ